MKQVGDGPIPGKLEKPPSIVTPLGRWALGSVSPPRTPEMTMVDRVDKIDTTRQPLRKISGSFQRKVKVRNSANFLIVENLYLLGCVERVCLFEALS
jgi:hypothetical protein